MVARRRALSPVGEPTSVEWREQRMPKRDKALTRRELDGRDAPVCCRRREVLMTDSGLLGATLARFDRQFLDAEFERFTNKGTRIMSEPAFWQAIGVQVE